MRLLVAGRRPDRVDRAQDAALSRYGFHVVRTCFTDIEGIRALEPGAILLDLGLLDDEALAACARIRRVSDAVMVAVTSGVDAGAWMRGLRIGIDDYLVRPFTLTEIAIRVRAAGRPARERATSRVRIGPLTVDPADRTVTVADAPVELTRKEFDLLQMLVNAPGSVLCREQIVRQVWRSTPEAANRTLEVHIASLRAKLGIPDLIRTVRGIGYLMQPQYAQPVAAAR